MNKLQCWTYTSIDDELPYFANFIRKPGHPRNFRTLNKRHLSKLRWKPEILISKKYRNRKCWSMNQQRRLQKFCIVTQIILICGMCCTNPYQYFKSD